MLSRLNARWQSAGWNEFVLLVSMTALCLGLWLFLDMAGTVRDASHQEIETRFMRALRNPDSPAEPIGPWWLAEIGRDISALGSAAVIITLSVLVGGYLLLRRQWGRLALIAVTVAGGYALSSTLKMMFDRPRPDIVPHLSEVRTASFPSGHSMVSSVIYLTLGALLAQATERRREKIYFIATAVLLTFLIGFSRVFLGVHYPTDVLAGWGAGTAWALACWLVARRIGQRQVSGERP